MFCCYLLYLDFIIIIIIICYVILALQHLI